MEDRQFLKGLFDGMRCGILCIDREGRIVVINEPAAQILGLESRPEDGTPVTQALADYPQIAQLLQDSFGMSHLPNREELVLGDDAESARTLGYTLSLITCADAEPAGVAMFFKDLTQIERKEDQERLRDRLAALGQMAASLAHEIRNPLASIEVTCSLLRRKLDDVPQGRELLDKITAEVRRLNRTISSGLEFVRPVSVNLTESSILRVLDEAVMVACKRRGTDSIVVESRVDRSIPPIQLDRAQIRQVFENLILNAIEAVGDEGRVLIEAELRPVGAEDGTAPEEPLLEVRVSDDGPGIPDEEKDKIFYPFFTTKTEGSGVGLSMAKKIVDCHRGLIDVDRGPAGGARFTVRLPMTQTDGRIDNP